MLSTGGSWLICDTTYESRTTYWNKYVTHMNECIRVHWPPVIYRWVVSHIWRMHVKHMMKKICQTHEWVYPRTLREMLPISGSNPCQTHDETIMSHIWMSVSACIEKCYLQVGRVTHMNNPCRIHDLSLVTHMNESCRKYGRVISHTWMSHVARKDESYHTHEWVMSHVWTSHVTHENGLCYTYEYV